MDVIFYEMFDEEEKAIKKYLPKTIQAEFTKSTIQETGHTMPASRLISIRTQSNIPDDWSDKIDGILTRSQGYDHLLQYREKTGTKSSLGYLQNYCARAVAEQAVLLMLSLMRKMNAQQRQFDTFCRDGITGIESKNKNALVIGVGKIGYEICDIAKGLRMNVKGVDLETRHSDIEYAELISGIEWADVVFVAVPLNESTQAMLNGKVLLANKKDLFIINIARGEITPFKDMLMLLDDGRLRGFAADVFEDEIILAHFLRGDTKELTEEVQTVLDMQKKDNVLFTPHNAFNTEEAVDNKARLSAESVVKFLKEKQFLFEL